MPLCWELRMKDELFRVCSSPHSAPSEGKAITCLTRECYQSASDKWVPHACRCPKGSSLRRSGHSPVTPTNVWSVSATGGHCAKLVLRARRKLCDLLTTLDKKASAPTYPRSIHQKTSRSDPLSDAASQLGCCRKETTTCPSSQTLNLRPTINHNYSCNWEAPVSSAKCGCASDGFSGTPSWQICRGSCLPLVPVPFQIWGYLQAPEVQKRTP